MNDRIWKCYYYIPMSPNRPNTSLRMWTTINFGKFSIYSSEACQGSRSILEFLILARSHYNFVKDKKEPKNEIVHSWIQPQSTAQHGNKIWKPSSWSSVLSVREWSCICVLDWCAGPVHIHRPLLIVFMRLSVGCTTPIHLIYSTYIIWCYVLERVYTCKP